MAEKYLYDMLVEEFGRQTIAKILLPDSLKNNLSPNYELRPYQIDAFQRFLCYFENEFDFKKHPSHLLFNMATGSGKTLIMAGLILYLYEKGYRNFLFFVNSTNIIEKTKDNFLNPASSKYLFKQGLVIGNSRVSISLVDNFEGINPGDINICFTTIQKLHSDLTTEKENSITFEDFRKHKVVLLADEAHHMNVKTKSDEELFESWENTVEKIFNKNEDNLLLEFTATHDYATPAMVTKYRAKVIIRYDLLQFRNDRFSKDVVIIQSDFESRERILQALILNQYKQAVASKHRINLKPILLFKAQRTVQQSVDNKKAFHELIDGLKSKHIVRIRKSDIPIVQRAFKFFDANKISDEQLVERLQRDFHEDFCISVNDDKAKEQYQILLNCLEDKNNRIRAIFAVKKLNEGWDVLNLFDIVRCYEIRDSGKGKIGATTVSEAQLIGRGARYFPFNLSGNNDTFRRKFDSDLGHELRVLEELHYHSINDNRYIAEIRQALIDEGLIDAKEVTRELKLKDQFKKTKLYRFGAVWLNKRIPKDYKKVRSFADLGVNKKNYTHFIATGHGGATVALDKGKKNEVVNSETTLDLKVKKIERNIVQSAIARSPFFTFARLKHYFPHISSMTDFMTSDDYLGGLEITFQGNVYNLDEHKAEKLSAMLGLLNQIEKEILKNITDFEGDPDFFTSKIHEVFTDRLLKFDASNPRATEDAQFTSFVSGEDWFAFNTIYGTSEEKAFVRMLNRQMHQLRAQYNEIYLLRNEGHFSIYNFPDGRAFQPDFVLFLREQEKDGKFLSYQLFIEPKGKHLREHDKWKATFLEKITNCYKGKALLFHDSNYRLVGIPFYNNEDENKFKDELQAVLNY